MPAPATPTRCLSARSGITTKATLVRLLADGDNLNFYCRLHSFAFIGGFIHLLLSAALFICFYSSKFSSPACQNSLLAFNNKGCEFWA
jgi:hypothetical protein